MPEILPQWVLKPGFLAENALRPLGRPFIAKYPPLHILRLDDEDPEHRDENVVDLGGAPLGGQHEVVDAAVDVGVEPHPHAELGRLLAKPAFEHREHAGIESDASKKESRTAFSSKFSSKARLCNESGMIPFQNASILYPCERRCEWRMIWTV